MKFNLKQLTFTVLTTTLVIVGTILAGTLTPSGDTSTATFYTLTDIYNKLTTNTYTTTVGNHSISTTTEPAGSMYTLSDIWTAIPTLVAGDFINSATYMGITGTYNITNLTPDNVALDVTYGTSSVGTMTAGATLTWEAGQGTQMAWAAGITYCGGLSTDQSYVWRLPSPNELVAACSSGIPGGFADSPYWSGVSMDFDTTEAYVVVFPSLCFPGAHGPKTDNGYVRCVH